MILLNIIHKRDLAVRNSLPRLGQHDPALWNMKVDDNGHLIIAGASAVDLVKKYGTPLYVVDKAKLQNNYQEFIGNFKKRFKNVEIGYSYKTNPLPGAIKVLHEQGACAEVISHFEFWLALTLGVPGNRIIVNGPAKTQACLELAVKNSAMLINIDGFDEIEKLNNILTDNPQKDKQAVAVRVVTTVGWSEQFGMSIREGVAFKAFEMLSSIDQLDPCGLHIHLGTGVKNIEIYAQAVREVLAFSKVLKEKLDIDIRYFDFGGGYGIQTVKEFSEIDEKLLLNKFPAKVFSASDSPPLSQYADAVIKVFDELIPDCDDKTIILEPGRAVSGSAQTLLLSVLAVKENTEGVKQIILDGGKNITIPLGYEHHEVYVANKMKQPISEQYANLYGPLCHPNDVLFRMKRLTTIEQGDVIAVMDAGAYFVPNQMNFSNPRPAAIMVQDGEHHIIREREKFEDIVARDTVI